MQQFLQQIINGLSVGSIYALFAVGYTLVFGVLDILNLAHSAVFMFGAAITYSVVVNHGQPFWVACIIGIAACALMGLVIEHVCLRPLRRRGAPPAVVDRAWSRCSPSRVCSWVRA